MLSADQVPVTNPHSRMQWPKWVVLIAGSTGSALRAVRPPNLHITPWYSARSRQIYAIRLDGVASPGSRFLAAANLKQEIRYCRAPDRVRLAYATVGDGPPILKSAHWLGQVPSRSWLELKVT